MGSELVVNLSGCNGCSDDVHPIHMGKFARDIYLSKGYSHAKGGGLQESWDETAYRVGYNVTSKYLPCGTTQHITQRIAERRFIPGGRYLYASGRRTPAISNCFLFDAADSRDGDCGWADTMYKATNSLMMGGGIGVVYSKLRGEDAHVTGLGGKSTGPIALMNMVNEAARYIIQGGSRRSAIWAGLHWWHPDVWKFISLKTWSPMLKEMKGRDYTFPAPMEGTNISIILDDDFFAAYHDQTWSKTYYIGDNRQSHTLTHADAQAMYWVVVKGMVSTGEPGFSINVGKHAGESNRNACCEATSRDDSDNCNLGSLNLARYNGRHSLDQFAEDIWSSVGFLLCGTLYGVLPTRKMEQVRDQNRRVGLGLMGIHEWLLRRGYRYGPCDELGHWLNHYLRVSDDAADYWSDRLGVARPIAVRSIAPTGTISIIGETTGGIEPLLAAAYMRRYLIRDQWHYQYVIDTHVQRLVTEGLDPNTIEDAYTLSEDVDRRLRMQAWVQGYVDQSISSTVNLAPWGSTYNNESTIKGFGNTLMKYLPKLRGVTAYPDGARNGQPLTRVSYAEAATKVGVEYVDHSDQQCHGGVCGT